MKRSKYCAASCSHCGSSLNRYGVTTLCLTCAALSNRECAKASRLVRRAIVRGELPPAYGQKCTDCGNPATVYDHRDYAKPLEVEAVCNGCNVKRGPALPFVRLLRAAA